MHHAASYTPVLLSFTVLLMCAAPGLAQDTGYIAGAGFADIRLFGGTPSRSPLPELRASTFCIGVGRVGVSREAGVSMR